MSTKALYKTRTYKIDENNSIDIKYLNGEPMLSAEDMAKLFGTTTEEVERLIQQSFDNFELDPNVCTRILPEGLGERMSDEEKTDDLMVQILEAMGYKQI